MSLYYVYVYMYVYHVLFRLRLIAIFHFIHTYMSLMS